MRTGFRRLELVSRTEVGGGATALSFRPTRRLRYRAGQHAVWLVPRGGGGPFTLSSAPEEELVTLATSLPTSPASGSRLKRALAALEPGSRVRLVGPLSDFTLDESASSVVMLAQGIGVTPFRSMLVQARLTSATVSTTLVHVAAQHPYRADTEGAAKEAFYPASRDQFAGHVAAVAEQQDATFMVSGSRAFVAGTTAQLSGHGIARSRIRRDAFYGYSGNQAL